MELSKTTKNLKPQ